MFQRILKESLLEVIEHPTLVRIAFLTGFVHTFWAFYRFVYVFYTILEKNVEIGELQGTLLEYIRAIFDIFKENINFGLIVFLSMIFIVGYLIAYPIGHSMMVSYIADHSTSKSLKIGLSRYFVTTIMSGILGVVTFGGWHISAMRYLYTMDILGNGLIVVLLILIGGFLMTCSFLYAYANISCVIDEFDSKSPTEQAQESLRYSSEIAIAHPRITIKFILLSLLLQIRFVIMTSIVIAIPALLVWLALQIGLIGTAQAPMVVLISVGILLVASIYINSIVDAFFTAYWHKLYTELKEKE